MMLRCFIIGERRIRVHTLCLPVSTSITEVINGADQQAIVSILSKMGVYSQYVLLNIS